MNKLEEVLNIVFDEEITEIIIEIPPTAKIT